MKACLLILLAVAPAVRAQVVECPKFYPWQDTVLAEVPYGHKGKGMVTKERLTGAGLTVGEFNGGGDMQGLRKNVKGGHEVDYGTIDGPKWLVCAYGPGNVTWWEQLDSKKAACRLQVRERNTKGMMDATLTCK
jgi:hypothetical protein